MGISRRTRRSVDPRIFHFVQPLGFLDAHFDLAHPGQILIELIPVVSLKTALHGPGIVEDKVQQGAFFGLATAYFVLKWLKNTEKFYVGLDRRSGR